MTGALFESAVGAEIRKQMACLDAAPRLHHWRSFGGAEVDAEMILLADALWRDRYRRIAERYVPVAAAAAYIQTTINEPRALFRVRLDGAKALTWRMPLGDEPGDGIWHERYYVEKRYVDKTP